MQKWIRAIWNKYSDLVIYIFFGALTTLVNFALFYPLHNALDMNATLAKTIAWLAAVIFAFFTNKPFVYRSRDWSAKVAIPEFFEFIGCRLFSGFVEIGFMFLTVDLLHWDGNIMNIVVAVFVVIINYIGGKLLFRSNKK